MIININLLPRKRKAAKKSGAFSLSTEGFNPRALLTRLAPYAIAVAAGYLGFSLYMEYSTLQGKIATIDTQVKSLTNQVKSKEDQLKAYGVNAGTSGPAPALPTERSQVGTVLGKVNTAAETVGGRLYKVTYQGDSLSAQGASLSLELLVPNDNGYVSFTKAFDSTTFFAPNFTTALRPGSGIYVTASATVISAPGGGKP